MSLPVIICIGTPSVMGDSLGPKVGDILRNEFKVNAYVYGGVEDPVNGVNYQEYIRFIESKHKGSVVFAVDASVGAGKDLGKIKYTEEGVLAGGALNKQLGKFGDIGILGVVAIKSNDNLQSLKSVPEERINAMSLRIAFRLAELLKLMEEHAKTKKKNTLITQNSHFSRCKVGGDVI